MNYNEANAYIRLYWEWKNKDLNIDDAEGEPQDVIEELKRRELDARQKLDAETIRLMREIVLAQAMELTK